LVHCPVSAANIAKLPEKVGGQTLRATASRLLFSCRSSGIVWMRIFAVCPLFDESIILVADHHLGSLSILLREIDGRGEGLLLAWES